MRQVSKKRAKENREMALIRQRYLEEHPYCMCACGREATDVHEIPRGAHRRAAFQDPRAWLALNRLCHDEFGDYSKWPILSQYCVKAICDVDNYDRVRLNELRSQQPDAISETDVLREILAVLARMTDRRVAA